MIRSDGKSASSQRGRGRDPPRCGTGTQQDPPSLANTASTMCRKSHEAGPPWLEASQTRGELECPNAAMSSWTLASIKPPSICFGWPAECEGRLCHQLGRISRNKLRDRSRPRLATMATWRSRLRTYIMDAVVLSAACRLSMSFKSFIAGSWRWREGQRIRPCSHKSGMAPACSTSAFPHSDHPADMPDRSELGRPTEFSIRFRVGFDLNFGHIFASP